MPYSLSLNRLSIQSDAPLIQHGHSRSSSTSYDLKETPSSPISFVTPFDTILPSPHTRRCLVWVYDHPEQKPLRTGDLVQRSFRGRDEEAVVKEFLGRDKRRAVFRMEHSDRRYFHGFAIILVPMHLSIIPLRHILRSFCIVQALDAYDDVRLAVSKPHSWFWSSVARNTAQVARDLHLNPLTKIEYPLEFNAAVEVEEE
ncbi:hypothetical protein BV25DRAFT_1915297 [Artomyces pyxidatus]|uniref:Uncharacterized protein n=1 Tax=Artomyces pyxidatus TaxID=48021 RepID=A0ACB8T3Y7_9AGAM|nr:hypothetical protein BV25DRAFT_1915297 [Artomyces pyxidatus]